MKLFKIIAGVILILAGVFCFANPGATYLSIAFLLGISMLIAGATSTFAFFWVSRKKETTNLILVEGIMTLILGCLVLANTLVADATIPLFFGMWAMFSGVLRIVDSYMMRKAKNKIWYGALILGVVVVLFGMYTFFNPVLADLSVVMQLGFLFVIQGLNILAVGFHLPVMRRRR